MAKLFATILATALVAASAGFDWTQFAMGSDFVEMGKTMESITTPEQQDILKTIMLHRSQWHPEAEMLLEHVYLKTKNIREKRALAEGRRLAKSFYHCIGSTNATCGEQVDENCNTCVWDPSFNLFAPGCGAPKCEDQLNKTDCCANPAGIKTGCIWDENEISRKCKARTCQQVVSGVTGAAAKKTECDKNPGCFSACADGDNYECYDGKADDYTCDCTGLSASCVPKTGGGAAAGAVTLLTSDCPVVDCSICLKGGLGGSDCAKKKKDAKDAAECLDRCSPVAQCDEEVECLFCGPKKSATCKAQVTAAAAASCAVIGTADTTTTTSQTCDAICTEQKTKCPNGKGDGCGDADSFKCGDSALVAGAERTGPVIFIAIVAGLVVALGLRN